MSKMNFDSIYDILLSDKADDDTVEKEKTESDEPKVKRYLMTLAEASEYFNLCADWIYDMSENADAQYALLIGEEIYIKPESFIKYLNDHFSI